MVQKAIKERQLTDRRNHGRFQPLDRLLSSNMFVRIRMCTYTIVNAHVFTKQRGAALGGLFSGIMPWAFKRRNTGVSHR